MSSAGAVKAGGVFVEIGADPRKFFAALNRVNKSLANMGGALVSGGGRLAAAGIGMAAPIVAAVRQGARFESTLLNIRASTGATAAEIDKIRAASMQMSQALGVGPTEAAGGMLELLKAGMSLDTVLGGAGKTAMEFAKVGEMDVGQAAVVMSDAMNVFKVSADVAANALSSAADASSTSIAQMSEAFSMSSAVAGLANQSIEDLSATLAILANAGVKGSDAGTSVKTMLMRLMAPADDAVGALDQLGLSVASFRGADGQMRPMVEIIGTLTQAMGGLDQTAKDDIFRRIFGADAIRAASILASEGVDGFQKMREAMASALPVGEKYKMMMSGLTGSFGSVLAAMQRMAIAITDAVAPALAAVVPFITGFIDGLTKLATDNKEAVVLFAQVAAAAIGIGAAMVTVGYALQALSGSIGLVLKGFGLFSALASPVLLVAAGIGAAVFALYKFKDQIGAALGPVAPLVQQAAGAIGEGFGAAVADGIVVLGDLATTATTTFSGIFDAISAGDLSGAMEIAMAGLQAAFFDVAGPFLTQVSEWATKFQGIFDDIGVSIAVAMESAEGFFKKNVADLGNPQAWGAAPAIGGVQAASKEELAKRAEGIQTQTDRNVAAMEADAKERSGKRIAAATDFATSITADKVAARNKLNDATTGASERRKDAASSAELLKSLSSASSLDEITNIGASMDALIQRGNVSGDVESKLLDAYYAAFSRVNVASAASSSSEKAATAGAGAAGGDSATSKAEVAGTFSSVNLGGMGFGSSLAERQLKTLESIDKNTKGIGDGEKVAA